MCLMAYVALNDAKVFYEERHDRGTFVKNIIMDNILPGDIYIRAKELHFSIDAPRACSWSASWAMGTWRRLRCSRVFFQTGSRTSS